MNVIEPEMEQRVEQQDITSNGCKSLGFWFYMNIALIVVLWGLMFTWYWQWSVVSVLFVIPTIFLARWWNKNRQHCDLNFVMTAYMRGFWIMSVVAILLQIFALFVVLLIFAYIFYLLFGNYIATMPLLIIAYVLIEEYLKLWFAFDARRHIVSANQVTKAHMIGSTSNALGYATFQGLLWLLLICIFFDEYVDKQWIGHLFIAAIIIAIVGLPMHLLTGYLIGLELTRDAISKKKMPLVSCGFKIVYLLLLWMVVMLVQIWSFVVCVIVCLIEYAVLIWYIKKIEKTLPFDYLQRVGQLQIFGYLSLPNGDDGAFDDTDTNINIAMEMRQPIQPQSNETNQMSNDTLNDAQIAMQMDEQQTTDVNVVKTEERVKPLSSPSYPDPNASDDKISTEEIEESTNADSEPIEVR